MSNRFRDKCPSIALARVGITSWEDYIQGWKTAQEDAPSLFPSKGAYMQYLKLEGFSEGARLAASVIWDIYYMLETYYGG